MTFISCGLYHSSCIGVIIKNILLGNNKNGECGIKQNNKQHIFIPLTIDKLKNQNIINIKYNDMHSYAKDTNNQHYLWGSNLYNQCITNDNQKIVYEPYCINNNVKFRIVNVFLSTAHTKLLCY